MIWTHGLVNHVIHEGRNGKPQLFDLTYGERGTFESDHEVVADICEKNGWTRVPDEEITHLLDNLYPRHWPYTVLPQWGWPLVRSADIHILLNKDKRKERLTEDIRRAIYALPYVGYSYYFDNKRYLDLRQVVKLLLPRPKPARCIHCHRVINRKRQAREDRWLWKKYRQERFSSKYMRRLEKWDHKSECGPLCTEKARRQTLALNQLVRKLESRQRIHERKIKKWESLRQTLQAV